MNAIGLIEPRNPRHPVEQKWKQNNVLPLRDFGIHRAEALRIRDTIVRRRFHLYQGDLRLRLLGSDGRDQLLEIPARVFGPKTTERVVRAGLDHYQINRCAAGIGAGLYCRG